MNTRLPTYVAGHVIRTNNATEQTGQGKIPGLWARIASDNRLLELPERLDAALYAVLFDYEADENGDYSQLVGIGLDDPATAPPGTALLRLTDESRVVYDASGVQPASIIAAWTKVWSESSTATLQRTFTIDIEMHAPNETTLLIAGKRQATDT